MNSFEAIFRANPELIEALNHARDKNQRLPKVDGANPDLLAERWSQVKDVADHQHRLTRFNIFTALNAMDYETRHSNFLAWLLNPNGTHGFGTKFLNGFLSLIAKKMPKASEATKLDSILQSRDGLKSADVVREFKRADLLVVDRTQQFVCLVENKIHTGEHSEQLTRYRRMVEQEFPGCQHLFVFLTLRPEAPSDSAYVSLTYAELYQGQIFDFVFLNLPFTNPFQNAEPSGITLKAGMKAAKPGYHELREAIYRLAKQNRALFNCADNECAGNQKNCSILNHTLCSAEDFRRLQLSAVKEKLEWRFGSFMKHQYPAILKLLRHPSVAKFKPDRASTPCR